MPWPLLVLAAYLVGSIPFGLLIGRARGVDIRTAGSGNIGATNVGRVLGTRFGILCFVLDVLKGAVPVAVAGLVQGTFGRTGGDVGATDLWWWFAVAAATVLGHLFPIYLRLRGGKGVATSLGALLATWPHLTLPVLAALGVWIAVVRTTKYVSLASVAAGLALPLLHLVLAAAVRGEALATVVARPPFLLAAALAVLVVVRHRSNLSRLRAGTEPRLGTPVDAPDARPPA